MPCGTVRLRGIIIQYSGRGVVSEQKVGDHAARAFLARRSSGLPQFPTSLENHSPVPENATSTHSFLYTYSSSRVAVLSFDAHCACRIRGTSLPPDQFRHGAPEQAHPVCVHLFLGMCHSRRPFSPAMVVKSFDGRYSFCGHINSASCYRSGGVPHLLPLRLYLIVALRDWTLANIILNKKPVLETQWHHNARRSYKLIVQ
jgi:hypothetical protein